MTPTEQAIYAAVFARLYDETRSPPEDLASEDEVDAFELDVTVRAIQGAAYAVELFREAEGLVRESYGRDSAGRLYREAREEAEGVT